LCRHTPCIHPSCSKQHQPGQHKPNATQYVRQATFTANDRCISFHDTEKCDRTNCIRKHGKSAQSAERCAAISTGMCEDFYSQGVSQNSPFMRGRGVRCFVSG
jgi:hypothetical protein